MTSFYTGVSGLGTHQNGINTTSHNLANINTPGYVRQQVSMADNGYTDIGITAVNKKQVGLGVMSAETRHIRDILIDSSYREQLGRQNFYASRYNATEEIEGIIGELEGEQFQTELKNLWDSLSEMAKKPDDTVARSEFIMNAETFLLRANSIYNETVEYQETLNKKVEDSVNQINALADKIYSLSQKISAVEAAHVETASDLRDQRDLAIDELAKLANISVREDDIGYVSIKLEGVEFINKGGVFHLGMAAVNKDKGSDYMSPIWPQLTTDDQYAEVFNLRDVISTENNTDVGSLKGILLARGGYQATFKDIPVKPESSDEKYQIENPDGTFTTDYAAFRADLIEYTDVLVPEYNKTIDETVVMKTQAMFDQLVNKIATMINNILSPMKDQTITAGTNMTIPAGTNINNLYGSMKSAVEDAVNAGTATIDKFGRLETDATVSIGTDTDVKVMDMDRVAFGNDSDKTPGTELFTRTDSPRYTVVKINGEDVYVYNPNDEFGNESTYSLGKMEINEKLLDDQAYLPFTNSEGEIDMKRGQELLKAWDTATVNLDPNNLTKKDITDYYSAMVGVLSNDGYLYNTISTNQESVVAALNEKREALQGVTSEEELTNLIKFQNGYNACSRYITTVADMLDTLINRVGNW